jgi:hypothetical protein
LATNLSVAEQNSSLKRDALTTSSQCVLARSNVAAAVSNPVETMQEEEQNMRRLLSLLAMVLVMGCISILSAQDRNDSRPVLELSGAHETESPADLVDHIIVREHQEAELISSYQPIAETYVQVFKQKRNEPPLLSRDYYYLGQADLSVAKPLVYHSMLTSQNQLPKKGFVDYGFKPLGFVQMVYIDRKGFDKQHYSFQYVRREFLGDVRCIVFDVRPLPKSGIGRFYGRIWAEDENYTVVRFNGVYLPVHHSGYSSHFDSWRLNVQPGLWLPAYTFAEEMDLKIRALEIKHFNDLDRLRFKAQTRFWGFNLKESVHEQEFTDLTVQAPAGLDDRRANGEERDHSPLQAQREWQSQAENNVISALVRSGLLAPSGALEKTLDGVVNNLEVTNNLDIEPPVRCRVLTTATFDVFAVGHVIVVSRGLLDVLPDEATLAAVLAQELGEIVISKSSAERYGFYDIVQLPSLEALKRFSFKLDDRERETSSEKAVAFLRNSPYKDNLASAGLFLKQFQYDSRTLRALVAPHLGDRLYVASQLTRIAPDLQPESLNQVAALPLGARIKLDPWSDEMDLIRAKPTTLASAREKMPLEVTPFMPYLTRYAAQNPPEQPPKVALQESTSSSPRPPNK